MSMRRLLTALGLVLAATCSASAGVVAVVGGTIVDPASAAPEARATVLIDGSTISAVGDLAIPKDAGVIDANGKFIVPGLWDMHAHIAAFAPIGVAPEHYVAYGVLGIRDMGGFMDQLLPLRAEIASGARIGPDIVMAGPTLNGVQAAPFHRVVRTDAEARTAVRELKAAGVDFIKIHRKTTGEAFYAIADEAGKQGLTFVGHVPLVLSWIEGSNGGMHAVEHAQTMLENEEPDPRKLIPRIPEVLASLEGQRGDDIWATLARNGTYFAPTLVSYELSITKDPPDIAEKKRTVLAGLKILTNHAARQHVRILAGTDVLEQHGAMLLRELELLVESGLTPQQALAAATATPCDALVRAGPGRIVVGAPASFLVVDGDPLSDIANLRKLDLVMLRGRLLDSAELGRLRESKVQ